MNAPWRCNGGPLRLGRPKGVSPPDTSKMTPKERAKFEKERASRKARSARYRARKGQELNPTTGPVATASAPGSLHGNEGGLDISAPPGPGTSHDHGTSHASNRTSQDFKFLEPLAGPPRKRKRSRRDTTIQATTSSCHVEIRQMEKEQTAKASPAVAVSRDTGLVPSTRRIAHANVDPLNTAATTTHESADAGSPAHYAADVNSEVCNVATGSSEMPMVIDTQDHASPNRKSSAASHGSSRRLSLSPSARSLTSTWHTSDVPRQSPSRSHEDSPATPVEIAVRTNSSSIPTAPSAFHTPLFDALSEATVLLNTIRHSEHLSIASENNPASSSNYQSENGLKVKAEALAAAIRDNTSLKSSVRRALHTDDGDACDVASDSTSSRMIHTANPGHYALPMHSLLIAPCVAVPSERTHVVSSAISSVDALAQGVPQQMASPDREDSSRPAPPVKVEAPPNPSSPPASVSTPAPLLHALSEVTALMNDLRYPTHPPTTSENDPSIRSTGFASVVNTHLERTLESLKTAACECDGQRMEAEAAAQRLAEAQDRIEECIVQVLLSMDG